MTPEQNRRQCAVCEEPEPSSSSYIHTVSKNGGFRRLCTDCLLKEHRDLFCSLCFNVFDDDLPPQHDRIICLNCPSIVHLSCSPSAAASRFTCPPCSDPDFSFFPKSRAHDSDQSGIESTKALVAAAKISVVSLNNAAAKLNEEAGKKILEAKLAKMRATEALGNLQEVAIREKASKKSNPNKRKNNER